jgi:phosphatidylserine/phosphatidylglycerophosphate/cardiolipin synthase-like enzyme
MRTVRRCLLLATLSAVFLAGPAARAEAADRLCDPGNEDCRDILIRLIRGEHVGIDVAFWFMEDQWYANELIAKWRAGVPVRVLVDSRANAVYPKNITILDMLRSAGIPMRERFTSGILHWKMMLFSGQNTVQFSGANYTPDAWGPMALPLYSNYTDEAIFFTDKPSIVASFRTRYDDLWVNTTLYRNYANITTPARVHGTFAIDPELNFAPWEPYAARAVQRYNAETQKIDVTMYRITDRKHTDAIIAARNRGIPIRLITEPKQYRDPARLWHSWNVDRLYMAGIAIRHRKHAGLNHQKTIILYGQQLSINGSSNWTESSDDEQEEHNIFTRDAAMFQWFIDQFERKWNNESGVLETEPFVPLPPAQPKSPLPVVGATGVATNTTLRWEGGFFAHLYDVYLGTSPSPPLYASNLPLGPSTAEGVRQTMTLPAALQPGTTYYWRVVGKTMANQTASSPTWSFTTTGSSTPPPPPPPSGGTDVVLYAADASVRAGGWQLSTDPTAAGGSRLFHADAGVPKLMSPLASPSHFFELQFNAEAGRAYRLWIRGKASFNHYQNDSVYAQFSGSVTSAGAPIWRIGTTSGTEVNLEDCSGCGLSGWGWQDNGWGVGVMGPLVYFASTGTQRVRIQTREDGMAIDQIVLSPSTYVNSSPGALKNDTTILPKTSGTQPPPPPPPPPPSSATEIVLRPSEGTVFSGLWRKESDSSAAGGVRVRHPDGGVPKITTPIASPTHYFELTFNAEAGRPYRIWIRGKADGNYWGNDSIFVQFDRTVNASGSAIFRIGTTSGTEVNLEDCSGCGLSEWGWQDNGWGVGVLGPALYFSTTGTQRMRIQTREDGLSIDQIVISASQYLNSAPGALKNDSTIVPR